ncbi:hypothetical protein D623_10022385 [Myotis brandtii]|uniref:Uncharacterized protein n=1 Tax=Myotis brandtii TaxID=109478 RepID=S7PQK8_MYOBR|nr:hypothetical protein D623_10022385 [Myotis brandtii]
MSYRFHRPLILALMFANLMLFNNLSCSSSYSKPSNTWAPFSLQKEVKNAESAPSECEVGSPANELLKHQ